MYSNNDLVLGFLSVVIVAVAVGIAFLMHHRGRALVEQWAAANGLLLENVEHRYLRKGPFFFRSGRGHMVYYVTIRDAQLGLRHAWVRVGGWFLGLLSDEVTVEWAD